jgi:hypothetical protein
MVTKGTQAVRQADGLSHFKVVGEVRTVFVYGKHKMYFKGLAVENLDVDVLVGIPCMTGNAISIRPAKHEIRIGDNHVYNYNGHNNSTRHSVCRAEVLRAPETPTTVWTGQFVEVDVQSHFPQPNGTFAVELRRLHTSQTIDFAHVTNQRQITARMAQWLERRTQRSDDP